MDKARKQRLAGLIALVLLFALYVAWTERPQIQLHYDANASAPASYSFKENGEETLSGEIQPGAVLNFPLRLLRGSDYRVAFTFHRLRSASPSGVARASMSASNQLSEPFQQGRRAYAPSGTGSAQLRRTADVDVRRENGSCDAAGACEDTPVGSPAIPTRVSSAF